MSFATRVISCSLIVYHVFVQLYMSSQHQEEHGAFILTAVVVLLLVVKQELLIEEVKFVICVLTLDTVDYLKLRTEKNNYFSSCSKF